MCAKCQCFKGFMGGILTSVNDLEGDKCHSSMRDMWKVGGVHYIGLRASISNYALNWYCSGRTGPVRNKFLLWCGRVELTDTVRY